MINKKLHENIEFSFGKGVGRKIYNAINNANHSVYVLTPYISQGYVDFLLRKKAEGIDVCLITTTDAQKGKMDEICKKVVLQHRMTDQNRLRFKNKAKKWCILFALGALIVSLSIFGWHNFHNNLHTTFKGIKHLSHDDGNLISIFIGLLLITFVAFNVLHRIKVFSYSYSTRFPFAIVPTSYSNYMSSPLSTLDTFVHAKIYIVDNKDMYIGSANLTKNGLKHNIESFVKISSQEKIKEIITDIERDLHTHCRFVNINQLGARLYNEPPY